MKNFLMLLRYFSAAAISIVVILAGIALPVLGINHELTMNNFFIFCIKGLYYFAEAAVLIISVMFIYLTFDCGFMKTSPSIPTCGRVKKSMIESVAVLLKKSRKPMTVVDLGSGWGTLLLPLARKFPQHRFIGYEFAHLPFWISKMRAHSMKNIRFFRQNIFSADITDAI